MRKPSHTNTGPNGPDAAHHVRWNPLHRFSRPKVSTGDELVRNWKDAWLKGAQARWSGTSSMTNPYQVNSAQAAAWRAGWRWAEGQPDRRQPTPQRLAHPLRRSTDRTARLIRGAQAGAVGVSVVTLLGWLWQMQRRSRK